MKKKQSFLFRRISVLSIKDLLLSMAIVPLFWPFPLWALMSKDSTDVLIALGGSYAIGIPFILFMSVTTPDRYWLSEDGDSACEGTPGGN